MKETSSNPVTLSVDMLPSTHVDEIARGERFAFGENWQRFLGTLGEIRIQQAEDSLKAMLSVGDLQGKDFIDVGSGSGIFSLAARRLGARVFSFDFDPQSVACTKEMKRRFFPNDQRWTIQEGSVLDFSYLSSLGTFDVVYSWGVLHHTGKMWQALDNVAQLVKPGGQLFIAIYNDAGWRSVAWRGIKTCYNKMPRLLKTPFVLSLLIPGQAKAAVQSAFRLQFREFVKSWTEYEKNRGMSRWHDAVDWIGGYPYEVASTDSLEQFYKQRGFRLQKAKTPDYKLACNELVLVRES